MGKHCDIGSQTAKVGYIARNGDLRRQRYADDSGSRHVRREEYGLPRLESPVRLGDNFEETDG